jgi:hypothetical protein
VGYPNKAGFFEILVDKEQQFSIKADTVSIAKGATFENSPDNILFSGYQQQMGNWGKKINSLQQQLKAPASKADSTSIIAALKKTDKEVKDYREDIIKKNPHSLLAALLITMREPELTGALADPKTKEDSLSAYNLYKKQYWEGVNFWDGRLAYTTFFEEKLDKYFNQLVQPHPDSVIKEIDYMLSFASVNEEMTRFLLIKFVNRYLNQKYMWEDDFCSPVEKYFASKTYVAGRKGQEDHYGQGLQFNGQYHGYSGG